ncbi:MAG: NfeD family protein [Candidatus Auribacterota bacterium]
MGHRSISYYQRSNILCCIFLCFSLLVGVYVVFAQTDERVVFHKAYLIPMHGEVDFALSRFISRSAESAVSDGADVIVFDIDTFGGRVDSALEISHTITNLQNVHTVGYISVKAISAGALIALSCNEIIMKENTTIGDCAPISMTNEGPTMLGEKFQSPLRAEFRKLADRNGYPVVLAEAMVSADSEVLKVFDTQGGYVYMTRTSYDNLTDTEKANIYKTEVVIEKDKLLTMHDKEALEYGFAALVVKGMDDVNEYLGLNKDIITSTEFLWSEKLVRFIDSIAPILMLLGLLGLYTEFKVPGFGLPGIFGITCFALVFGSKFLVGLATYTEVLLFLVGLILLFLEIFVIPGFGITGVTGIFCVIISLYLASQSFVIPQFPWEVVLARQWLRAFLWTILVFFVTAILMARILPVSWFGRKIMLSADLGESTTKVDMKQDMSAYLNQTGMAVSMLRPSGRAKFQDTILDVITDGSFIEAGTAIKVIRVEGKKLVVEQDTGAV